MAYSYEQEKPKIFTADGLQMLLKIRDNVGKLLDRAGAVRLQEAIKGTTGDSWTMLACIDLMVELGEIREITVPGDVAGQHRVFIRRN